MIYCTSPAIFPKAESACCLFSLQHNNMRRCGYSSQESSGDAIRGPNMNKYLQKREQKLYFCDLWSFSCLADNAWMAQFACNYIHWARPCVTPPHLYGRRPRPALLWKALGLAWNYSHPAGTRRPDQGAHCGSLSLLCIIKGTLLPRKKMPSCRHDNNNKMSSPTEAFHGGTAADARSARRPIYHQRPFSTSHTNKPHLLRLQRMCQ